MDARPSPARLVRLHVGVVLATSICVSAFVIEVARALDGNALSWAYVFEWPLLGGYGIYMWRRLVAEERGSHPVAVTPATAREDADLQAWNEYLADLHAADAASRRPPPRPRGVS